MLLAITACSAPPSTDGRLPVVVSFYPLQFVAERVGGDKVAVSNLTTPGAEPHDLELTAKQVASLTRASLVVYQKGFQPAVDSAVADERPRRVLDVSTVVPLHEHETGDDEGGAHGHDHQGGDPHTWLDPSAMVAYATAVADALSAADPGHAGEYRQRADALVAELRDLDRAYADGLRTCDRRVFVTSHAAFGYLAERYDLEQVGIAGLEPGTEPSPARIAEVQRIVRERHVTTIFYETLASPKVAETMARDLGVKTAVLDPVEGLTPSSRGSDYLEVMRSNLAALKEANGCR